MFSYCSYIIKFIHILVASIGYFPESQFSRIPSFSKHFPDFVFPESHFPEFPFSRIAFSQIFPNVIDVNLWGILRKIWEHIIQKTEIRKTHRLTSWLRFESVMWPQWLLRLPISSVEKILCRSEILYFKRPFQIEMQPRS